MKFFAICFFLISPYFIFSQQAIGAKSYVINNINNYSFLGEVLKDKRVVLLGEQTHGDGATFDEKVNIIKHLSNKLGFNTIVFESGMYENYKAWKLYSTKKANSSIYNGSIYSLWSNNQSFQRFLDHVDRRAILKDTIKIIGFDCQEKGQLFEKYFMTDLKNTFQDHQINIQENTYAALEKAFISKDLKGFATNKKDSLDLYQQYDLVLSSFQKMHSLSKEDKMIKQVFLSQIAQVDFEIKILQKQKIATQNPRDLQMAKNLIFLTELYPNEKMICWGASYHFSNRIKDFEYTDTTESYLKDQIALENEISKNSDSTLEDMKSLKDAVPMGEILKNHFKDKIYSLAFSSYEGEYGIVGDKPFSILSPPLNSIEKKLVDDNSIKVLLDFDKKDMRSYYCSALGNMPIKANWNSIFDGLIFIKTSYAPTLCAYKNADGSASDSQTFTISGVIKDSESDKFIPNADLYLINCNRSVVANGKGTFQFNIPRSSFNDKLIISAMGYYSDTLTVSQLERAKNTLLQIKLKKETDVDFSLSEVVVSSAKKKMNSLSAKAILKKAKENIEDNYCQIPFNQKFFFRAQTSKDNTITLNEEASINTYSPNGIVVSRDAASNYFGEILQYRNTTNNTSNENWKGIGYLGVIIFRNILLSNQNVLYKTNSFDLKKEKIVEYNGKSVYVISFINNAPDVFSTGFGNPPPKSAIGYIYIDATSFAVLKFEHYVVLHPDRPNDDEKVIVESTHRITETFKLIDGKYFINYCNEKVENKYLSKKDKKLLSQSNTNYDLMSVDVNTSNVAIISRPIDRLKLGVELKDDPEYWRNNNFILEEGKAEF
jgi:erythromycin esterase-like protein